MSADICNSTNETAHMLTHIFKDCVNNILFEFYCLSSANFIARSRERDTWREQSVSIVKYSSSILNFYNTNIFIIFVFYKVTIMMINSMRIFKKSM